MTLLPEASDGAVGADSCACCPSITSVLVQEHVAHGLAGAQVMTGALSAFGCKGTCLSGFVNSGKVDQSSIPEHEYSARLSVNSKCKCTFYRRHTLVGE